MADTKSETPNDHHAGADRISRLRAIAGTHLLEIDQEKREEEKSDLKRQEDLERYAKHRKGSRSLETIASSTVSIAKMRTAGDVLDRLKWDNSLEASQYKIGYLERFEGIKETSASHWITDTTDEDWIPQHRIKYFKRFCGPGEHDWEVVWDREKRVDKIFGSGSTSMEEMEGSRRGS